MSSSSRLWVDGAEPSAPASMAASTSGSRSRATNSVSAASFRANARSCRAAAAVFAMPV